MTPDRVLVAAPNWLGDAVMALPALRTIRAYWPAAHLAVAARPSVAPLYAMVADVQQVVPLESRAGLASVRRWRRDAARLAADRFDLAVLLPNSFLSAWIAKQAGIAERWGYDTDWRGALLTRRFRRPPPEAHQADYYLGIVGAAGMPLAPREARLEVPAAAREQARTLLGRAGPYVVFAPGAAYGHAKQWPPEHFAELAVQVAHDRGAAVVLVGAGADAQAGVSLRQHLAALPGGASVAIVNLIGRTDLPTLAAVFAEARAVVANDSGAMHLASAVGAPVVALFGPTNERQTSPLAAGDRAPVARLAVHAVWCRPCMLRECPLGHACLRGISAADVAALLPPS